MALDTQTIWTGSKCNALSHKQVRLLHNLRQVGGIVERGFARVLSVVTASIFEIAIYLKKLVVVVSSAIGVVRTAALRCGQGVQ